MHAPDLIPGDTDCLRRAGCRPKMVRISERVFNMEGTIAARIVVDGVNVISLSARLSASRRSPLVGQVTLRPVSLTQGY